MRPKLQLQGRGGGRADELRGIPPTTLWDLAVVPLLVLVGGVAPRPVDVVVRVTAVLGSAEDTWGELKQWVGS